MHKRISDREKLLDCAAFLSAEDELSDHAIARLCGITRRTLMRWKKQPAIQQKIDEHLRGSKMVSEVQMILERHNRIVDMDVRWQKLQYIIRERAKSPEMRSVPGGSTGLLHRRKVVASHVRVGLAPYYELDRGLLREIGRLEGAAAKALGQCPMPKYQPTAFTTGKVVPSGKQHRAALLIADGTRSDLEIATACGVNRRTLARWKEQPSFRTRVAELRTVFL